MGYGGFMAGERAFYPARARSQRASRLRTAAIRRGLDLSAPGPLGGAQDLAQGQSVARCVGFAPRSGGTSRRTARVDSRPAKRRRYSPVPDQSGPGAGTPALHPRRPVRGWLRGHLQGMARRRSAARGLRGLAPNGALNSLAAGGRRTPEAAARREGSEGRTRGGGDVRWKRGAPGDTSVCGRDGRGRGALSGARRVLLLAAQALRVHGGGSRGGREQGGTSSRSPGGRGQRLAVRARRPRRLGGVYPPPPKGRIAAPGPGQKGQPGLLETHLDAKCSPGDRLGRAAARPEGARCRVRAQTGTRGRPQSRGLQPGRRERHQQGRLTAYLEGAGTSGLKPVLPTQVTTYGHCESYGP